MGLTEMESDRFLPPDGKERYVLFYSREKSLGFLHDWHCGLRGIRRDALERMTLRSDGMEFATEMIAEAAKHQLRISEVPVALRRAKENRQVKLRTIRDGLRHLWYIIKTPR